MKYRHNYIVQYQDIDDTRRLRLHTMENRLLIVAGKVADEIGIGIPYLMQHNCTWFKSSNTATPGVSSTPG